jgi:NAD(P)-dependent dehydrogenase (short-subunit alcohol dehydrogenase family)
MEAIVMRDLFDMDGTVAVVSGGGGWLGAAIVRALAGAGAHVVSVGRDEKQLLESADAAGLGREQVTPTACDVTTDAWPRLVAATAAEHGRLDVLVNNAHVGAGDSLRTAEPTSYLRAAEMALVASSTAMNAALPGFDASVTDGGSPSVINVASMYGMVAPDPRMYDSEEGRNPPYYGAAKAGLIQLTRYAAAELGPRGVRVNSISPGPFPGPPALEQPDFVRTLADRTMLGRVGTPEDIETAVLFLASPASRFVTGTNVVVDGGWTAW